ncbi:hypothetical protein [Mariniblastus fucicola]|uniref:Recombination-associated protein RdgC n=1 Tax=Mariniblastus fucicola TaxID=980251 RepID=A0A5B9P8D1_9BACT|nr:hypothetical protein [Mariniblastus fucicola]QEG22967.1 hypothetical protein MFFC18_28580 [Mariniblastus fucicola]
MGFLQGSVTFERFRVTEDPTGAFSDSHIEKLKKFKIGKSKSNLHEQPATGFAGGAHLLDTDFDATKNIIGEAMHFGIRVDSCQIPGGIKRAWTAIELAGIMKDNEGGRPSKKQREEAVEAVDARCAAEAEKGNFLRMSETSVLWDAATETVYLGSTSEKANDNCLELLDRAFGIKFRRVTSGSLAVEYADRSDLTAEMFNTSATAFHPEGSNQVVWWNGMNDNYDYLGNEFLLWLWWHWETKSNVITLSDESEVSGMFARTLSLDCPIGEHGKESISADSPVALPEAILAIGMGKLPRKAGLTLVREDQQYDFTLQAETLSIGSARISQIGNDDVTRDSIDRIESIRQLCETLDLLFEAFCERRIGKKWKAEQQKLTQWLRSEKPVRQKRAA